MTGFPPYPVILGTLVITAIGCDNWGSGIQRNEGNPPWAFTQQDGSSLPVTLRLAPGIQPPSLSGLPSDGLEGRGKSEHNTLFYWIPEQARE